MFLPIKLPLHPPHHTFLSLPYDISPHMIHYDRLRDAEVLCPVHAKTLFCFIYTPKG